ncbi:hypothetical protein [Hamadaea tsunoensis]|uniref:hypothetical protein n=1 Tax=Hamadaea tsunoensis TaxID=53368 RepID=UPI0004844942|nr:hypothetical protein [Hamadaea tsunoensis]
MRLLVVAVLVLAAAGSCAPRPAGQADRTAVPAPDPRLLTVREIGGAGWRAAPAPEAVGWAFALSGCAAYAPADYPAQQHRTAARAAVFTQGHGRTVQIVLEEYADGWAPRALTDIRAVLTACPRYQTTAALVSHTIEDQRFTADDAVLVRSDSIHADDPAVQWWTAVVRRGAFVATVAGTNMTAAEVRRIAAAQAVRIGG